MVFVVEKTLTIVSLTHGSVRARSWYPPQMSTIGSPLRSTATDAPTSLPASRLRESASATPAKRSSK
jgi:hypothetical protein